MKYRSKWFSLAMAGAGLLILAQCTTKADDSAVGAKRDTAREPAKVLALPAGFTTKDGTPSDGIFSGLAKVTDRAVTKGDFNSMLAELSRPDRERAREFKGVDQAKLDAQIDRIRGAWKSKYGKDFEIDTKAVFGSHIEVIQGEVADPALALSSWPVAATADQPITASATVTPDDSKSVKKEARQEKLEKGRSVAVVRFAVGHDMPDLTVSMIHHLPAFWRIDIPDTRTGEQIYNDLLAQLTWLGDHTDQWPADMNDAGRALSYHVVAALYGVDLSSARKT